MQLHPDKVPASATDAERANAEAKFKLLGEALETLTQSQRRELYDKGYDKKGIDEYLARQNRHHHHG